MVRALSELIAELARAGVPFEILAVDDTSADGTLEMAAAFSEHRPQVRWVSRRRLGGFERAVRAGIEPVRGEVVVGGDG